MKATVDFTFLDDSPEARALKPAIEAGLLGGATIGACISEFKDAHPDADAGMRKAYLNALITGVAAAMVTELSGEVAQAVARKVVAMVESIAAQAGNAVILVDAEGRTELPGTETKQ